MGEFLGHDEPYPEDPLEELTIETLEVLTSDRPTSVMAVLEPPQVWAPTAANHHQPTSLLADPELFARVERAARDPHETRAARLARRAAWFGTAAGAVIRRHSVSMSSSRTRGRVAAAGALAVATVALILAFTASHHEARPTVTGPRPPRHAGRHSPPDRGATTARPTSTPTRQPVRHRRTLTHSRRGTRRPAHRKTAAPAAPLPPVEAPSAPVSPAAPVPAPSSSAPSSSSREFGL